MPILRPYAYFPVFFFFLKFPALSLAIVPRGFLKFKKIKHFVFIIFNDHILDGSSSYGLHLHFQKNKIEDIKVWVLSYLLFVLVIRRGRFTLRRNKKPPSDSCSLSPTDYQLYFFFSTNSITRKRDMILKI